LVIRTIGATAPKKREGGKVPAKEETTHVRNGSIHSVAEHRVGSRRNRGCVHSTSRHEKMFAPLLTLGGTRRAFKTIATLEEEKGKRNEHLVQRKSELGKPKEISGDGAGG